MSVLRPGKKFFSHVGTKPPLPGYYQYFWGVNFSCSRKQHGDGTFQDLNFSNVISSKSFPDMLKYEINSKLYKINLHNTGNIATQNAGS